MLKSAPHDLLITDQFLSEISGEAASSRNNEPALRVERVSMRVVIVPSLAWQGEKQVTVVVYTPFVRQAPTEVAHGHRLFR